MLHAPFLPYRTGHRSAETQLRIICRYFCTSHRLRLLFCEKNRFYLSLKTELIISVFDSDHIYYNYYNESVTRETTFAAAIVVDIGKQWIFNDAFLIDLFIGGGFGVSNDGDEFTNLYGFLGGYNSIPFALTGGFKIGFLFH